MMVVLFVVVVAVALAIAGYAGQGGRQHVLPIACRAVAWASLGLLLANPGCPAQAGGQRPLVLLDASLSMRAAGGRWAEALDSAQRWGEVRLFGDPERQLDTVAGAGISRLSEMLVAAQATGRPVVVVSDGELEDAAGLVAGAGLTVRLFPRAAGPAATITGVAGPGRLTARDTLRLRVTVKTTGLGARQLPVVASLEGRELARATASVAGEGEADVVLRVPPGRLPVGEQLLSVAIAEPVDRERRDDARTVLLSVSAVPGIVLLADRADWDARFLLKALQQVADLPVAGFARLDRSGWRRMGDLSTAGEGDVREAAGRADLLVIRGEAPAGLARRPRAAFEWPSAPSSGERGGDWYLAAGQGGPTPGALAGFALDSFPPATAVRSLGVDTPSWVGLTAQLGRRGTPRPVLAGYAGAGRRRAVLVADGLWRWAFRGGSSEQAYRALVASTVDWLLAVPDSARGAAAPARAVVANGRPLHFDRAAGDTAPVLAIRLQPDQGAGRADTLRFGPDGRASLWLPPGSYRYELAGGGRGRVVVEEWSPEWFPRPITLEAKEAAPSRVEAARGLRDTWWLYGLGVVALCGEWWVRRRRGLR